MATDHSSFHAKFENITEHGLENIFREQLPRSANGRVPRQFLVNVVAQKKEDVQTHCTMLNELAVAGKILQISHDGYYGLICASDFGGSVSGKTVQTVPFFTV